MGRYDNLKVTPLTRITTSWMNGVVDALNELASSVFAPMSKMAVKSLSVTPGTNSSYGGSATATPTSGKGWIPSMVKVYWGGSFASGETVTVRITAKFSDGSSSSVTVSSSGVGEYWLTDREKATLWNDGVCVSEVDVDASSNASATSVTVTVTLYMIES